MLKIKIICLGKTKEPYLLKGIDKFLNRISFYAHIDLIEIKLENNRNCAEKIKRLAQGYIILLDILGQQVSSGQFAVFIQNKLEQGCPELDFLIGGCSGFPFSLEELVNFRLSLSNCTFTHQMIRLLLLEQIYRAFTIIKGHPYHK